VGMSIFETLLRKWLHWKYSYTWVNSFFQVK
jgi:hypothetical protein